MVLNIVFALLTIFLSLLLNNRGLVDGPGPTIFNFMLSLFFLIVWFLFGVYRGRGKKTSFLIFAIVFWVIGIGISLVAMNLGPNPLILVALVFRAPLNGFAFFEFMRGNLFLACMFLPLIITCIGYFLGSKKFKNYDNKDKEI